MTKLSRDEFYDKYLRHSYVIPNGWGQRAMSEQSDLDTSRCSYYVRWSIKGGSTCSRKPTTEIASFGFCIQHARIVRRDMKQDEVEVD